MNLLFQTSVAEGILKFQEYQSSPNMFVRSGSDLTSSAKKFINSLPSKGIHLFRKKRRMLPIWSSFKYYVVIKSSYMIYYPANNQEIDEQEYHYVSLTECDIKIVRDDTSGFVFTLLPRTGNSITFIADNEKNRSKFIQQVAMVQKGPPTLSDFKSLSVIGKGHYGRVLLVEKNQATMNNNNHDDRSKPQQLYALKEMKLGSTKQKIIQTERMVMEWISDHPFVLGLECAFTQGRTMYLVTKFMPGGDLFIHMQKRGGCFSERTVQFYAVELILALEYLHSVNIMHRDIKPENILLGLDGHIKLADMGLSKRFECMNDRTHTICGTDAYLPPEMVSRDPAGHGRPVDLWQLGCVLYELAVGHPPFYVANSTQRQSHHRILYQSPKFPKNLTPAFQSLITSLLAKKACDRIGYQNGMTELKNHPFFCGINWTVASTKKLNPPFIPSPAGDEHIDNFDKQFTQQPHAIESSDDGAETPKDFSGFDYIHPNFYQSSVAVHPLIGLNNFELLNKGKKKTFGINAPATTTTNYSNSNKTSMDPALDSDGGMDDDRLEVDNFGTIQIQE